MSYHKRIWILAVLDCSLIWLSVTSSYLFRFNEGIPPEYVKQLFVLGVVSSIIITAAMIAFRLYNRIWQYASIGELLSLFKAVTLGSFLSYLVVLLLMQKVVPLSITLRTYETVLLCFGGLRFCWRIIRDTYVNPAQNKRRALIVGAGACGTLIAKEIKQNPYSDLYPVAFIDDDPLKQRLQLLGIPIAGDRNAIAETVERYKIEEIIIAIPSATRNGISEIMEVCKQTRAKLKYIPRIHDLLQGRVSIQTIRNVEVEDLLGRDPVELDMEGIADYITDKVVMVTGAGGSIGSELCRQIAPFRPKQLLLLGHGENSIYTIEMELRRTFPNLTTVSLIADIQDRERIETVFQTYRPQVVFHAAAHKHVPLMEANPSEAIKNNVFGTRNVAECADRYKAERFVMISSDKAVNPTSIMGATKRIAEMIVQSINTNSQTKFAAVRFGNVLGSRGSVIPRFKEQIARGGPVTVTHPDMIRYFMTIPEASQLVIQAGALAQGGEVFILDMGQPVKIYDLAKDLIRLSGFEPEVDIDIEITGVRPGEKLYEELLTAEEGLTSTKNDRILVGKPTNLSRKETELIVKSLENTMELEQPNIRKALGLIVPGFQDAV